MVRAFICLFSFLVVAFSLDGTDKQRHQLTINLITIKNGRGLEADQRIMKEEIEALGHIANCYNMADKNEPVGFADINIFFQIIDPYYLPYARRQWLVPNPEWFVQPVEWLSYIDLVLCRTHEVERIFTALGKDVYFTSFTSRDCLNTSYNKDFSMFAHIAGISIQKGTMPIVETWKNNPSFGQVTVLQYWGLTPVTTIPNVTWIGERIPEKKLTQLQNSCGIHLCLSETEGFGHYIQEAMSTEAVVITTDAPPMNEFITDPRCLVPYKSTQQQALATNYYVDPEDIERVIKALLSLPKQELEKIGKANRKAYLKRKTVFHKTLDRLLKDRDYVLPE